jgi:hypothetical protein
VPHPNNGEQGCVLEVFNVTGESIAVVIVPVSDIKLVAVPPQSVAPTPKNTANVPLINRLRCIAYFRDELTVATIEV